MANYTDLGNGAQYKKEDGSVRISSDKHLMGGGEADNSALATVEQVEELLDERPRVVELDVGHVLCDYSYRDAAYKFFTYGGHVATLRERHIEEMVDDATMVSVEERMEQFADEHPCITGVAHFKEQEEEGPVAVFDFSVADGETYGSSNIGAARSDAEVSLEEDGYHIEIDCIEHGMDGNWEMSVFVDTDE